MTLLYPEDRRGKELPPPPRGTLFDPARHEPPRGVIAALDNLAGWTAEAEGLAGAFGVSPALALWGEAGTFIEVAPAAVSGTITLRPPVPICIPDHSDVFELWVTGDTFDWQCEGPRFTLSVLAQPSGSKETMAVVMADGIYWPTYSVRIIHLPEKLRASGGVTGLQLTGCDPGRARRFGLATLCVYRDIRPPLVPAPRPKRPLRLPAGQTPGLHVGPGSLPFPTREETLLPDNLTAEYTSRVERQGDVFRFCYTGRDADLAYVWSPKEDPLRLNVQLHGKDVGEALVETTIGGNECVDWVAVEWRGNDYVQEDPLPADTLRSVPTKLSWRGRDVPMVRGDGMETDRPLPYYEVGGYGGSPIYHLFREIVAEREMDLRLETAPPKEHAAFWMNSVLCRAEKKDGKPARTLWNGVWTLHLRPGVNVLAMRLILWSGGFCEFKPLAGGAKWAGPWRVFGPSPYNPGAVRPSAWRQGQPSSLTLDGDTAAAVFEDNRFGPITIRMHMLAKSMLIDIQCPSGELGFFQPGRFRKLHHGRVRTAPALRSNAVLLTDVDGKTVFFSLLHDWYRSNASYWTSQVACSGDEAWLQGPLLYLPTTAGARNGAFERYVLTCSPVYEEVLPNIPNPPSPWAVEAGRYVFQESWGPMDFDKELAKAQRWAALGMTDILHLHHEAGWTYQAPAPAAGGARHWVNDGCTLRLDIAPAKGGNEAMQKFLAAEQALGLRAGLYTNYTDYYPLNPLFRSDRMILQPDGSRQTAFVHSFAMKPSLAVEYDAWFAPRIARRFHPDTAYTDVHTCIPPWDRVDYDARVPGAGTFAATYYAWGELLLNDQRHYGGPVFSEGGSCQWMYAGLVSGNYGQIGITADEPPDPAFNLLKIHPLETDVGLSVGTRGWIAGSKNLDDQVDRYLLGVLTYGHIAYLPEEPFDRRLLLRVYHMARAASSRYAGLKPAAIHYQDETGRWLTVSEALARGLDAHCRLRIVYAGGLTLYANWSRQQTWTVNAVSGGAVVLPPNGYWLDTPQGVLCASVLVDGGRCDRAQTPAGWYADGRGRSMTWGPLALRGSAALLVDPAAPGHIGLIDGGGNNEFRIARPYAPGHYRALSADREVIAECQAQEDEAGAILKTVPGAVRYEWSTAGGNSVDHIGR